MGELSPDIQGFHKSIFTLSFICVWTIISELEIFYVQCILRNDKNLIYESNFTQFFQGQKAIISYVILFYIKK
jgi:uncharacterized membrane protein